MTTMHEAPIANKDFLTITAKTSHGENKCGSGAPVIQSGPRSKHIITTIAIY